MLPDTPHFNPKIDTRLMCGCGCGESVKQDLLWRMEMVRIKYGKPMRVTSGYRCAEYNKKVGGATHSKHLTGDAIDIACANASDRAQLIKYGLAEGLSIGVRKDILHFDNGRNEQIVFTY